MNRVDEIGPDEHVRGPQDAALTLIEYGDFQCPYCARAHAALTELVDELGAQSGAQSGGIRLVFRHLPLSSLHPLAELAESLDLDIERFRTDVEERRHRQRVQGDLARAHHDGATATPTFFINGVRYRGDSDRESLRQALDEALGR
jgi:protein-disulfide isomerase